jgi:hypothetical protein
LPEQHPGLILDGDPALARQRVEYLSIHPAKAVEDTDPGPPFANLVSVIRIKGNGYYRLTGVVGSVVPYRKSRHWLARLSGEDDASGGLAPGARMKDPNAGATAAAPGVLGTRPKV